MRFEPLTARQRFLLATTGAVALGFGLLNVTTAQSTHKPNVDMDAARSKQGVRNVQVMDITPARQDWPRFHVIYDFDRNTAMVTLVNEEGVYVRSMTRLDKAAGTGGGH